MTPRTLTLLCLALLGSLPAVPAFAAKEEIIPLGTDDRAPVTRPADRSAAPRVELFGQVRLGNRPGAAPSAVKSCGRVGERVAGLRLRVLNSPATLSSAEVHFGNGTTRVLPLRRQMAPNSDTGWILFGKAGGRNPCVKAIVIQGQNGNLTPDSAVIQIFGLVTEALPRLPSDARRGILKTNPKARLTLSQAHP
jgi:hypothetical protein